MTLTTIFWTIIKILTMVLFALNVAGVLTWAERRQSAMMQDRIGPNRAVIKVFGIEIRVFGLLHTAADAVKMLFKEDFMPPKADKILFSLAPILCVFAVFALTAAIPFGDTMCLGEVTNLFTRPENQHFSCGALGSGETLMAVGNGLPNSIPTACVDGAGVLVSGIVPHADLFPVVSRYGLCGHGPSNMPIDLQVASLNIGILFIFAMAGQGIIGAAIAGWSSDNKFSLMGALRAASQMVSYEVTMGMSLIGAMMVYGTLRLDDMARWQGEYTWGIFVQPVAFFLFFTAAVAESKRVPFDLPEAESELVSGYFTEYAGFKFGMFYLAEFAEVVTSSMLLVTIFLGGWNLPFFHRDGLTVEFGDTQLLHVSLPHLLMEIIGPLAFFGKTIFVCWLQMFIRWSLPRFRYDQLMKLGWKILLPTSLANILVTGCVYLAIDQAGSGAASGLRVAAQVTQAIIAVAVTYYIVRAIIGFAVPRRRIRWDVLGTAAARAAKLGGVKDAPMQA